MHKKILDNRVKQDSRNKAFSKTPQTRRQCKTQQVKGKSSVRDQRTLVKLQKFTVNPFSKDNMSRKYPWKYVASSEELCLRACAQDM